MPIWRDGGCLSLLSRNKLQYFFQNNFENLLTKRVVSVIILPVKSLGICVMAARQTLTLFVRVQILHPQPTKNALLSTKTKVRFLNDVCLRQMMLASPMMTASPNDVCLAAHWANITSLRHEVEQHHFEFSKKHHIDVGAASLYERVQSLTPNRQKYLFTVLRMP